MVCILHGFKRIWNELVASYQAWKSTVVPLPETKPEGDAQMHIPDIALSYILHVRDMRAVEDYREMAMSIRN